MTDRTLTNHTAATTKGVDDLGYHVIGGNGRKMRGGVDGTACGTAFPGSPTSGDRFYRSDLSIEYFYDGTRWLSAQLFLQWSWGSKSATGQTATLSTWDRIVNPYKSVYSIYVENFVVGALISGTGAWTVNLKDTGGSTLVSVGFSTGEDTTKRAAYNTVSTASRYDVGLTEDSGTSTFIGQTGIEYRLVG